MLASQMAQAKHAKGGISSSNTKALPNLNLFKGMNQLVGKKRPAIPLEPLNLLENLMNKNKPNL